MSNISNKSKGIKKGSEKGRSNPYVSKKSKQQKQARKSAFARVHEELEEDESDDYMLDSLAVRLA